jgi:hypothetical protein
MAACVLCRQIIPAPDSELIEVYFRHFQLRHQDVLQSFGPPAGRLLIFLASLYLSGPDSLDEIREPFFDKLVLEVAQIETRAQALIQCPESPSAPTGCSPIISG